LIFLIIALLILLPIWLLFRRRDDRLSKVEPWPAPLVIVRPKLGPPGPFPTAPLGGALERRWLHYAFLSCDNEFGLVANIALLGPPPDRPHLGTFATAILLLHRKNEGWCASQFNAETSKPFWSAFRQPHPFGESSPFAMAAKSKSVAVDLALQRSSRPCTSQCAPFADNQFFRWQSETGVIARGDWQYRGQLHRNVEAIGYHERVRGYWGWPEIGGWVFGFANDPAACESGAVVTAPPSAVVFTLIQPQTPSDSPTASVMLWRHGRLVRHFPRRCVSVAVRGELDKDYIVQVPALSHHLGVPPMATIPRRLVITAAMGKDWVVLDFLCEEAARIVISSETSINPFSVHEVIGPVRVEGQANGDHFTFTTRGIVEFAGGAGGD
jgi:hypothetical protein